MKAAPRTTPLPTMWWDGAVIIAHDLPKPGTSHRWTPKRKALFMSAMRHGLISREDFLSAYNVSEKELDQWLHSEICSSSTKNGETTQPNLNGAPIACGDLVIHPAARRVTIGGRLIDLTSREYRVLECIAHHRDKGGPAWKEAIMEHVYKEPDPKIIDVMVCKIRKKLADASDGNDYLDTVWGRGYLLRKEPVKPMRKEPVKPMRKEPVKSISLSFVS